MPNTSESNDFRIENMRFTGIRGRIESENSGIAMEIFYKSVRVNRFLFQYSGILFDFSNLILKIRKKEN
ncbi:hypothetical protein CH367_08595 [Leptospira barantonii]|uniref:Uncharacterized protein n=1 Tax=Leptospira barantonii TaxID=2023184 RepID=A0ABX4NNT8_9LEPT|nr:hypothetical protein CH367_08595 [Leptospira barantonii]